MLTIRTMTAADIPLGVALKDQALWNQTAADWQRFLKLEPEGCFVAQWQGQPAGTAAAFVFDAVGWIAMVLVDRALRGRGIATRLMEHAMAYLDRCGVQTVRLDATPLGRPIYERLGFTGQWEVARLEGVAPSAAAPLLRTGEAGGADLVPFSALTPQQFAVLVALDRQTAGADRRRLLVQLDCDASGAARAFLTGDRLRGYAMLRRGSRAMQIGPAVAVDDEAGHALLQAMLGQAAGRAIFIDVPEHNRAALGWAQSHRLTVQRRFTRMARGRASDERAELLWASSGPEKG